MNQIPTKASKDKLIALAVGMTVFFGLFCLAQTYYQYIQLRRGTAAQWTSANSVLHQAEIGVETDTFRFKIGDGNTAWNNLLYPTSRYVDRGGATNYDWLIGSFTTDTNWYALNCANIVPAGAQFITFRVKMSCPTASWFKIRKNGSTDVYNVLAGVTAANNAPAEMQGTVACDANRVVQYYADNTATWESISVVIKGWIF